MGQLKHMAAAAPVDERWRSPSRRQKTMIQDRASPATWVDRVVRQFCSFRTDIILGDVATALQRTKLRDPAPRLRLAPARHLRGRPMHQGLSREPSILDESFLLE